ncbi:hypothetical protein Patl1_13669 [Pistacia atlantica]|uniref:Uncharacterized protein n=1 Tax=Pistacia atlantica TaxID=434234 RepID=A0ACC1AU94_9ROSI|nr:hypothetical protein Patl1_13669 [Pistacia atlantica]
MGFLKDHSNLLVGLDKDDPLSPYLFIIGVEALSRLIQDVEDGGVIKRVPMGHSKMSISHLFYADDCLLFSKILEEMSREIIPSGSKSSHPYDIYLGLPTLIGRDRTRGFNHILDRNDERRIHWCSWDKMKLSKSNGGLGFRDLELFNLAMLAKQGWRLLHYPNSFAARVLFAKYYPKVNTVCQIPISVFNRPNKLVWRCSQNGLFSVRSAYHLQVESQLSSRGQSSSVANENKKWKNLWKLPITNAEKLFLWKACQDILPTKCNLVKKRVIEDPFCPFCCSKEKDVLHALWGCAVAKDIWSSCSLNFQKMNDNFINFRELVMFFLSELEEKHLA